MRSRPSSGRTGCISSSKPTNLRQLAPTDNRHCFASHQKAWRRVNLVRGRQDLLVWVLLEGVVPIWVSERPGDKVHHLLHLRIDCSNSRGKLEAEVLPVVVRLELLDSTEIPLVQTNSATIPWLSLLSLVSSMLSLLGLSLLVDRHNLSISVICPRACKTCSMVAAIGQNTRAPLPCELVFTRWPSSHNKHVSHHFTLNKPRCTEGTRVLQSRPPVVFLSCPQDPYSYLRVLAMGLGFSLTWPTQAAHLWLNRDSLQWCTVQASNLSPSVFYAPLGAALWLRRSTGWDTCFSMKDHCCRWPSHSWSLQNLPTPISE